MSFLRADKSKQNDAKSKQNDTKPEECGWLSGLIVGLAMAGKMTEPAKIYIAGLDGQLKAQDFELAQTDIDVLKSNVWSGDDPHLAVSGGKVVFQPEEIPGVDSEELFKDAREMVKEALHSTRGKRDDLVKQIEEIEAQLRVSDPYKAWLIREKAMGLTYDWKKLNL